MNTLSKCLVLATIVAFGVFIYMLAAFVSALISFIFLLAFA